MPPLVLPALACLAGALGGAFLCLGLGMAPASVLVASTGGALAAAGWAAVQPGRLSSTALLAACVGAAAWSVSPPPSPPLAPGPYALDGIVSASPTPAPHGCRLLLARASVRQGQRGPRRRGRRWRSIHSPVEVILRGDCLDLSAGDHLRLRATGPAHRSASPGTAPPGTVMRFRADGAHVVRLRTPTSIPSTSPLVRLRRAALAMIHPERSAGRALLAALLVGARGWLSARARLQFRQAGAAHLLAISGLHVGLVAWLVFGFLRRLLPLFPSLVRRVPAPQVAALVSLGLTWLYVELSGAGLPAQRAGWMASALLAAPLLGRRANPWSSLALAALVTTIRDPTAWWSPGCQLSYVAVAGILLGAHWAPLARARARARAGARTSAGAPANAGARARARAPGSSLAMDLASPLQPWRRLLGWLGQLAWTSGVATLATAPLVALHFGPVAGAGILVNLAALPLLSLAVVPLGLAGLAAGTISPWLGSALITGAAASAEGLLVIVSLGAQTLAPALTAEVPLSAAGAVMAYAVLIGLLGVKTRPGRWLLAGGLAGALLLWLPASLGPAAGTGYRIDVLDVGDGDAILLTFPGGRHALVDAPGSTKPGHHSDRLVRRLRRLGVRRLDFVLATHPHADHIGGLPDVIAAIPTRALYHGGQASSRPEWRRLCDTARSHHVPIRPARSTCYGAVCVRVLWPWRNSQVSPWPTLSENNNSVVIRLESPVGNVLLTGDLEHAGEAALLARGRRVRADVLKLAHHGRPTASSLPFLRAISPRLAVVSAGRRATALTHHARVVRRHLQQVGARILSTASAGRISITLAPWGIRIQTQRGGDWLLPPVPARDSLAPAEALRPLPFALNPSP